MSDFDISIYDTLSDVEGLWREVEPRLALYPFQTFDWLSVWHDVTADTKPQIAVVKRNGTVVLILPLCVLKRHGLRQLTLMASDVSDYHAPLIAPDFESHCPPERFGALFAAIIARVEPFDYLHIRWMPGAVFDVPNPLITLPGVTASLKAYSAVLPESFAAYLNRKRKKIHHDTERQLRRLAEHGIVNLERVTGKTEIVAVTALMLEQKARRFITFERASTAAIRNARSLAFYSRIGAISAPDGGGHVACLQVGSEVIATHVGFQHRGRFYYIMPGFDASRWGRFSPGRVLMEHLMRESIEGGCAVFDMTIGDERYKMDWINTETQLFELIMGASPVGKLFCAGRALARRSKARLKALMKRPTR